MTPEILTTLADTPVIMLTIVDNTQLYTDIPSYYQQFIVLPWILVVATETIAALLLVAVVSMVTHSFIVEHFEISKGIISVVITIVSQVNITGCFCVQTI